MRINQRQLRWTFVCLMLLYVLPGVSIAQVKEDKSLNLTGEVFDLKGHPIESISVVNERSREGAQTDSEGRFSITGKPGDELLFTGVGYIRQSIKVNNASSIKVNLQESTDSLDQVVVVGYGTQRKSTLTGSVAQINSEKITVAPIANTTNMLAGQLAGLVAKQTSGIPGADGASLSIRGFGAPLIIVDGIETSLDNIDANQIESVSILKDGAASIYGARAGNGVILVTTKKGKVSKPTLTYNGSYTLQGSTKVIKPASSAQRAQYEVDKWLNAGKPADQVPFTDEEIQKFKDGSDPKYLNTDWFDASIRRFAPQQNHNVGISGGTDKVKYYGYFGANKQETILKTNGGDYNRYNFQTNVEAKVTDDLTASMDMLYIKEQKYYPSGADGVGTNNNFWRDLIYGADPSFALSLPDKTKLAYAGIPYGSPLFATNADLSGYQDIDNNTTQFKGELNYRISAVPGLSAKGTVIYRTNSLDQKVVKKQEKFYTYSAETNAYTYVRSSQDPMTLSRASATDTKLVQQYSLNYDNTFGDGHHLTAMGMYEYIHEQGRSFNTSRGGFNSLILEELFAGDPGTAANNSSSYGNGRISWIGRVNYDYKDRYMIESIIRADASSRFADGSRWGYFPSVSLGWNIAKEAFMGSNNPFDLLKLRASYGASGYDAVANFAYLTGYSYDGTYTLGSALISALSPTGLANPNLTWERMGIYNVGVDFALWNYNLYGELDAFHRKREGIPGNRANSLPSSFGATLPLENLNSQSTNGIELHIGTRGSAGKLNYDISGNIAYSRSKWIYYDEAAFTDPDEIRLYKNSGRYTDRRYGYVFDGLFTSQQDIDAWPVTFDQLNNDNSSLRPGDVKYKDLNGDGVINWRDQKQIGKGATPHWTFGLNIGLQYGSFDFSALIQGAFDYTTYIDLASAPIETFYSNYWDAETNNDPNALIPRPAGSATNDFYSDYRNHNTAYARLKNLSFGYTIPASILKKAKISKIRIFVAGTNLLTTSSLSKYNVDPEMPEGYGAGVYYPQQFTLSAGCNITF